MDVCVIGAGIIGLSSAVAIQERLPGVRVTLIAQKFDRHTTSYGSGGLIVPLAKNVPEEIGSQWCMDSARYFHDLAFSAEASEAGVQLVHGYELTNLEKPPVILKYYLNARKLDRSEQERFIKHFKHGYAVSTSLVDMPVHLSWLMSKFVAKGGKVIKQTINSFEELSGQYEIVVNCSGLGSQKLTSDPLIHPMRGQTIHLHAPWVKTFLHSDEKLHVFPFSKSVFVGAVKQPGETDMAISEKDSHDMLSRTVEVFPPLKGARVMWEWVGLRPQRDSVRLEEEVIATKGKPLKVIHNYGHGSFGVSLSWGCAVHVANLVEKLRRQTASKL